MAVDLGIGTVSTTISAADPEFFRSDEFRLRVMAIVREELEREQRESQRRESDMRGLRKER
jgi:hypothetical protein